MGEQRIVDSGRYYDAPTEIRAVAGVQRKEVNARTDSYRGTADALAAAGLLQINRFPGRDGQNSHSAALRPRGVDRAGRSWSCVPGYMQVQRQPGDIYRILLKVSAEERARRVAREEAIEAAGDDAAEFVLRRLDPHVREYVEHVTCLYHPQQVATWFRDADYLARTNVSREGAEKVLFGLRALELARARRNDVVALEKSLDIGPMTEAKAALSRFGVHPS